MDIVLSKSLFETCYLMSLRGSCFSFIDLFKAVHKKVTQDATNATSIISTWNKSNHKFKRIVGTI